MAVIHQNYLDGEVCIMSVNTPIKLYMTQVTCIFNHTHISNSYQKLLCIALFLSIRFLLVILMYPHSLYEAKLRISTVYGNLEI